MFDTLAIVHQLTAAGIDREQADAIADAVRQAADHGDHVTPADLGAAVAGLDARMAAMESRLTWRLVGAMAAIGAILRFIG